MSNEEMFLTILNRMDKLDSRMDKLESDMNLEFYAVRTEMDMVDKSWKKEIAMLNDKVDRLMFTKG